MVLQSLLAFFRDVFSAHYFGTFLGLIYFLIIIIGSFLFGISLIPNKFGRAFIRALSGFVLFLLVWGSLGFLIYAAGGTVTLVSYLGVFAAVIFIGWSFVIGSWKQLFNKKEIVLLIAFILIALLPTLIWWEETRDGTVRAVGGSWGDGAIHTLNLKAFVLRESKDISLPIFSGELMREPQAFDFTGAMFYRLGLTLGGAFALPAAISLASLIAWTAALSSYFLKNESKKIRKTAFVATALLLPTSSGLQWLIMATQTNSWSIGRFFTVHDKFWNQYESLGLIWASHFNVFFSQKHYLLAAAFLAILASILIFIYNEKRKFNKQEKTLLTVLALVAGLLPLFHAHAFIVVALLWFIFWLLLRSRFVFFLGLLIILFSLPVLSWYQGAVVTGSFIKIAVGYVATGGIIGWIFFWLVNLGFFLPLSIYFFFKTKNKTAFWLLGAPALFLFALGNLVRLQPYHWDNFKIFLFAWLLVLPFFVSELIIFINKIRNRKIIYQIISLAFGIIIVLSMVLTSIGDFPTYLWQRATYPLYTLEDRNYAKQMDKILPEKSVVLAASDVMHRHPITLTGRNLVAGYGGWVWSRGLDYTGREAQIGAVLSSENKKELCDALKTLRATHMLFGEQEIALWGNKLSDYMKNILGLKNPEFKNKINVISVDTLCSAEGSSSR